MKKKLIKIIETLYLVKKYRKHYVNYYFNNKRKIYRKIKEQGIRKIKAEQKDMWKLWYNTCYFSGVLADDNNTKVFIKIMGPKLKDCFYNEITVNEYISKNSKFLAERRPAIIATLNVEDYYIIVFEFKDIKSLSNVAAIPRKELSHAISEYGRIGILHTDFGLVNTGKIGEKFYFFDYGTSLCPDSNKIRLRNAQSYNHKDKANKTSLSLIKDPDYYYDDVVHFGFDDIDIDREKINFIIGKGNTYYAKLGEKIVEYEIRDTINSTAQMLVQKHN